MPANIFSEFANDPNKGLASYSPLSEGKLPVIPEASKEAGKAVIGALPEAEDIPKEGLASFPWVLRKIALITRPLSAMSKWTAALSLILDAWNIGWDMQNGQSLRNAVFYKPDGSPDAERLSGYVWAPLVSGFLSDYRDLFQGERQIVLVTGREPGINRVQTVPVPMLEQGPYRAFSEEVDLSELLKRNIEELQSIHKRMQGPHYDAYQQQNFENQTFDSLRKEYLEKDGDIIKAVHNPAGFDKIRRALEDTIFTDTTEKEKADAVVKEMTEHRDHEGRRWFILREYFSPYSSSRLLKEGKEIFGDAEETNDWASPYWFYFSLKLNEHIWCKFHAHALREEPALLDKLINEKQILLHSLRQ